MPLTQRFKVLLACCATAGALVAGETALRFTLRSHYYVWPPHIHRVFTPYEDVMPGVSGASEFSTNSQGIRGDELSASHTYRILAIGGSTTECLYLDQHESWPDLMQQALNAGASDRHVWVGNAGMSGRTTRHHVTAMQHLPLTEMKIDVVVLLIGINDLSTRLSQDRSYDPNFMARSKAEKTLVYETFSGGNQPYPDDGIFFKRTATWRLLKQISQVMRRDNVQDEAGKIYIEWREHRRRATEIRSNLPDLTSARAEYARNVAAMIDIARERAVRLILVTQPTLWRADLTEKLTSLLWLGGVGEFQKESGKPYYSVAALEKGMKEYNDTLLHVCEQKQAECVDLAADLQKDTTVFYDDTHFNESGARSVSEVLSSYIRHH